jgi:flavin-binding protein dodecin
VLHDVCSCVLSNTWRETARRDTRFLIKKIRLPQGQRSNAIARAHKTLRNLRWFEVIRTSGHVDNGKVRHYQVTLSVGFTMGSWGRLVADAYVERSKTHHAVELAALLKIHRLPRNALTMSGAR